MAFKKFSVLWLFSTSPVFIAILLSPIPAGDSSNFQKLLGKLGEAISASEQYVYAATFITPIFYIIYERFQLLENDDSFKKKIEDSMRSIFHGYGYVSLAAVLILFLTISSYTAIKIDSTNFENTFMYLFTSNNAIWIYLYAIFCWYLSILDGTSGTGDFVEETRNSEEKAISDFSRRVGMEKE